MAFKHKIPAEIMEIIELFDQNSLSYILFKCEHIFKGENKNLDILFETDDDYLKAGKLLEERGFALRLSENIEKYKKMYCGWNGDRMVSIHLHREIAWHGIKALDKKPVFEKKKVIAPQIIIPGMEDSILIHAGHVLFENFRITEKERGILKNINDPGIDHNYIKQQLVKNHWKKGFRKVISCEDQLDKKDILTSWICKLYHEPFTAAYLSKKAIMALLRKISLKRKGCLIALIGVNGSGKSTLSRKILEGYKETTSHLGVGQQYYYFGWKPEMFLTELLSGLFKRRDDSLFKKINYSDNIKKFDLFQELLFIYSFAEFYYRYLRNIKPQLNKGYLVVTDRYFYDFYGQYPYAKNSLIIRLLLKLFPQPDFSYVLDVGLEKIIARSKTDEKDDKIIQTHREVMPAPYLQRQRENYLRLTALPKVTKIDNDGNLDKNVRTIIGDSWKELIR